MCGIAGKLQWGAPADIATVRAMTDEMARRGPDADGFYHEGPIALGHRRLAIIDLSEAGRQPMSDVSGRYWITFNGEIYNYQELRAELIRKGATFRSHSDTEVIIEAYKAWGVSCLSRFNGMFAFALWDTQESTLFVARDRLGKKPLFYAPLAEGGVVFSSELKALMHESAVSRTLSERALIQYLTLGYVLGDECIIQGVKKLAPAHYFVAQRGRPITPHSYWNLAASFQEKVRINLPEACEELNRLIVDATKIRMISDVPLGAFLSGGLDSSAIVAAMRSLRDPRSVKTFSIGFQEKSYSELDEAARAASHLGVSHHDKVVTPRMAESIADIVYYGDEPFADTSMIPVYYLSAFAREQVTVALSGDGGDEIFAGYETFAATTFHRAWQRVPGPVRRALARCITAALPVTHHKVSFDYKVRKFLSADGKSWQEAHYWWRTLFSPSEVNSLYPPARALGYSPYERSKKFFQEVEGCHYLDQAMYVETKTWLPDDILVKADRMSMAQSLELRCPLLDYRIVEFAASLPVALKMKGLTKKYLFKKSQEGKLPHHTIYRKKSGFNSPVAHWLRSSLQELLNHTVSDGPLATLCDPHVVRSLIARHEKLEGDHGFQLFALLNLGLWCERFFRSSAQHAPRASGA